MIGPTAKTLSPVTREENVRIGPISVFALIIIIPNVVLLLLMRNYIGGDTLAKGFKMG